MKKMLVVLISVAMLFSACTSPANSDTSLASETNVGKGSMPDTEREQQSSAEDVKGTLPQEDATTGEDGSAELLAEPYVHYVTLNSTYGDDLIFPCIRGQEVLKEEDHVIYKNSGVTMEISLLDKSEAAADILLAASGISETQEGDGVLYNRSGDSVYVVDDADPDFTVLYMIEVDAYADQTIFERALELFGIEEGVAE